MRIIQWEKNSEQKLNAKNSMRKNVLRKNGCEKITPSHLFVPIS